ncbi:MAG: M48 family metallopeptidase [Bacilli bacterium]|nr:M48 family metallopeptidase [Bacilli bacterium]
MTFLYNNEEYEIKIEKKKTNKNTYIRVKPDLTILITTSIFARDKDIIKLVKENEDSIIRMIENQKKKKESNTGFYYLGKKYEVVYVEYCDISFGEDRVFINKNLDIDKWYKKQAKKIFQEHFDVNYNKFTEKIPYPDLKIRKMSSRWGVCNTKLITVTLNLELIKRDTKYLDYVIMHELSHLIEANHSPDFWEIVEKNCPDYKKIRKEMKYF